MNKPNNYSSHMTWSVALLLTAVLAACGGRDPILGVDSGVAAPTVTAVAPVDNATGVAINNTIINAAFSEAVMPTAGTVSLTVTCSAPCVNSTGTVALNGANNIATYTLTPATTLSASTLYTATVSGVKSIATGLELVSPFVWHFTTGILADTTRPRVTLTQPVTSVPGPTTAVPSNTAITAVFTEDMAPASIDAFSFTVICSAPCVSPAGSVSYAVGTRTASFIPTAVLSDAQTYTATITTAATDLASNTLAGNQAALPAASDYVWLFTTAAAIPPANISVQSTTPANNALAVCLDATVNASFNVPSGLRMDAATVTSATFILTEAAPSLTPVTASSVVLDGATGLIATFTPQANLTDGITYTATVKGTATGVKDEAIPANTMLSDFSWNFTAANCVVPPPSVNMGLATPFAIAATAGITNTPTAPATLINGDVVLDPNQTCNAVTVDNAGGFGLCGGSPPTINGQVITNTFPDTTTSTAIKNDLNAAFLSITPPAGPPAAGSLGGGIAIAAPTTMGDITGNPLVLGDNWFTPGVYTSITSIMITDDITIDGQGDPNATFVFQSASSLDITAGAPSPAPHARILLVNGAKASNIWWQVGSSATLGLYAEFEGNILAAFDITMETGATSCGRLMAGAWVGGDGKFVFDSNVVSVPGNGCPP